MLDRINELLPTENIQDGDIIQENYEQAMEILERMHMLGYVHPVMVELIQLAEIKITEAIETMDWYFQTIRNEEDNDFWRDFT